MTTPLGKTLTIGFDFPTHGLLRIVAGSSGHTNVGRVVRDAVNHYLDQDLLTPIDRTAAQINDESVLAKVRPVGDPSLGVEESWISDDGVPAPREEKKRVSVAVSGAMRDRLEERALREGLGYAELIRIAANSYLAELITRDVIPTAWRQNNETTIA